MNTRTIKASDLRDGDVQVSDGQQKTRTILAPEIVGGEVHFHTEGSRGFLTFRADEDVVIQARG